MSLLKYAAVASALIVVAVAGYSAVNASPDSGTDSATEFVCCCGPNCQCESCNCSCKSDDCDCESCCCNGGDPAACDCCKEE